MDSQERAIMEGTFDTLSWILGFVVGFGIAGLCFSSKKGSG